MGQMESQSEAKWWGTWQKMDPSTGHMQWGKVGWGQVMEILELQHEKVVP